MQLTKIIVLQFFLKHEGLIPEEIFADQEPNIHRMTTNGLNNEDRVLDQLGCDVRVFSGDLYRLGYEISNAYWQERERGVVVRFCFDRDSKKEEKRFTTAFQKLSCEIWNTWSFTNRNPNKTKINFRAFSFEKARCYLFISNGTIQIAAA